MSDLDDDIELDDNGLPINPEWFSDEDDYDEDYDDYDEDEEESQPRHSSRSDSSGRYGDKSSPTSNKGKLSTQPSKEGALNLGKDTSSKNLANLAKSKGGLASKGGAATSKATMAGLKAAAPYIGIALLVIVILIILIAAIMAIVSFFEEKTDPANMTTNSYITNEYFYGIRTVYIDDEQLANSLQLSYKQYVIDVIENFEQENPSIDITISLPTLNTDENLTNETSIDSNIVNLSLGIANIIATGSSEYNNIDFSTLYPSINFFGFDETQGQLVSTFIANYIEQNNLYLCSESINLEQLISATTTTDLDLQYIYNQCEKVMIKDQIATAEGLSDIEQRQYIASIYMPNKNIEITSASYTVANQNEDFTTSIKLIEVKNGNETIHLDQILEDDVDIFQGINWGSVTLNTFTNIDSNNISAFENEISLFDAIKKSPTYKDYFTQNAETSIYSWKPTADNLLYLQFEANNNFIYTEFDINIKGQ